MPYHVKFQTIPKNFLRNANNFLKITFYNNERRKEMDNSLRKIMTGLFGISGIGIVLLAWLRPMSGSERILSTIIGLIGLSVAIGLSMLVKNKVGTIHAKAESTNNG
jgi:hypothetical protein